MTKAIHNINLNPKEVTESQNQKILDLLLLGCSLTNKQANKLVGSDRLAARVYELRQLGWDIQQEMILVDEGKRVARYYL
jgi:hypothetical protein